MRSKSDRKNNSDIAIDLTSMLDVIFIVLMVVMCNVGLGRVSAEELQAKIDAQESELEQTQETLETYEEYFETEQNLEEHVAIVVLRADYDESDPTTRHIRLLRKPVGAGTAPQDTDGTAADGTDSADAASDAGWESVLEEIELKPGSDGPDAFAGIGTALGQYLSESEGIPVLLSVNDERILYRDWEKLSAILDELGNTYTNLYYTR